MISFFSGVLITCIVWFIASCKGGETGQVDYNHKLFNKDWNGLKEWLKEKSWNLAVETEEWRAICKKIKRKKDKKHKKEYRDRTSRAYWQEAKIVFSAGVLDEFFNEKKFSKKLYEKKRWKLSKDGNKIIRK